jgi:hypothetical protein
MAGRTRRAAREEGDPTPAPTVAAPPSVVAITARRLILVLGSVIEPKL